MDRHNKTKLNIPMCAACVLFCMTLFSFHISGGLYARYISSGSGGDDARVAGFKITESCTSFSDNLLLETVPGTESREIQVINDSEVAVGYTVTIENKTKNIPFKFQINECEATLNKCSVTSYMQPDSETVINISAIWEQEGALDYVGMVDLITITVNAQQVD